MDTLHRKFSENIASSPSLLLQYVLLVSSLELMNKIIIFPFSSFRVAVLDLRPCAPHFSSSRTTFCYTVITLKRIPARLRIILYLGETVWFLPAPPRPHPIHIQLLNTAWSCYDSGSFYVLYTVVAATMDSDMMRFFFFFFRGFIFIRSTGDNIQVDQFFPIHVCRLPSRFKMFNTRSIIKLRRSEFQYEP